MIRQFLSFASVGVVATAVQYVVLIVLVRLDGMAAALASGIGLTAGALVSYYLNYRFTFRSDKKHSESAIKFFSVAAVGLGLNSLIMVICADGLGIHYLVSQVIATMLVLMWNFAANRTWTFRSQRRPVISNEPARNANSNL